VTGEGRQCGWGVELKRDVQRAIADRQKALSHKLQIDQERVLLKGRGRGRL
jgi:hypothetical protein